MLLDLILLHFSKFQNICENLGIPYLQIQGCAPAVVEDAGRGGAGPAWDRNKKLAEQIIASPYVNKINNRFVGWPISEIIGGYCFDTLLTKHNYRISSQDNHPNEAGHNLISQVLYNELCCYTFYRPFRLFYTYQS